MKTSSTYVITCVEDGEVFVTYANSSAEGEALKQAGEKLAAGWGARVVKMEKVLFKPDAWDCDLSDEENLRKKGMI